MKIDSNKNNKDVSITSLKQIRPILTPVEDFKGDSDMMAKSQHSKDVHKPGKLISHHENDTHI